MASKLFSGIAAAAFTSLTVQESMAAPDVNCNAIHKGLTAEFVSPPISTPGKKGTVLKLNFSGEAALATGISSITFNLPKSSVSVATPYRPDPAKTNISIYSVQDAYKNPRQAPAPNKLGLECAVFKKLFFSCARAQQYEPILQNPQPNTVFTGAINYKLGQVDKIKACEGTVFAPAMN